jgi:PQQ-like domain/Viral BACON domain
MRTKFGQNGWRASGDHQRTVSFHPWLARVVSLVALLLTLLATASPVAAAPKRALSGSHLQISPAVVNETLNPNDPPISTYSVTLTNSGAGSSTWAISSTLPSWLSVSPTSDTLASGSSENLTLTFTAPSTIPQTYSTNLMLSDPGADDSPLTLPVNLSVGYYSRTWYFAEGYTGGSFTEYLTLANPNPDNATVTVQYLLDDGSPLTQTYSVLSNSRYTINVNHVVGPGFGVALAITSDLPIMAERPMYFTYTGMSGISVPGGTDTLGATSLGTTFAFAYLDTTAKHHTYLTVLNQNSVAIQALVKYYPANGGVASNRLHTISARSRGTILVNSEGLGAGTFSAVVSLSATSPNTQVPALGLVERPMYFNYNNSGQTGGTDVIGYAPQVYPYANQGYCSCAYVTNGTLMAGGLDETTGLLEFTYPYDRPLSSTPLLAGRMVYSIIYGNTGYGSPAAARGGRGGVVGGSASTSQLVAMNSPAYPQWALTPGPSQGFDNSPVSDGANVYIGIDDYSSPDSTAHYMDALDNWSGMVTWSTPIDSYIESQPVEQNGALYFTTGSSLYALSDANGQILWQDALPTTSYCYGPAIAGMSNGVIYTRTCSDDYSGGATDEIEGIDSATGATVWSDTIQTGGSSLVLKSDQSSLYADDGYGNV